MPRLHAIVVSTLGWLAFSTSLPAAAADRHLPGHIPATAVRVIDGDTIEVRAQVWLGQEIEVRVRLAGVDVPEMKATCEAERATALEARNLVVQAVAGTRVQLVNVPGDKSFGRVIANVVTTAGEDLSSVLLASGLGVPYRGGRRVTGCCGMVECRQ
jgi:endonuclease YncB( thermonuclease family)